MVMMQFPLNRVIPAFVLLASSSLFALGPEVGAKAPEFVLNNLGGTAVKLSGQTARGPVVLILLRGFPGYQCPLCNRQVNELIQSAQSFADAKARVLLVYPGPATIVHDKAQEFVTGKKMPGHFELLLDPDFQFTNLYGLRWDAPKETAYPSTFVLDRSGRIVFAKVSQTHGGRSTPKEILEALTKVK